MRNSIFSCKGLSFASLLLVVTSQITFSQPPQADSLNKFTGHRTIPVTSAVAEIKSEEFNKGNINDPVQLIQGKVSGLSISKQGSDPNMKFDLRLRGVGTLNCPTEPLFVIDGMIGASPENVDPNDIESLSILKDGSASIYGVRGSNGVIFITTKKSNKTGFHIEYNGSASYEDIAKSVPAMTSDEWRALSKKAVLGTDYNNNTYWIEEITKPAFSTTQNIALSGGNGKTTFRASFNVRNGDGILINTGYNQLNGRINVTQKAFNDKLTLDLNLGGTERKSKFGFGDAFYYAAISNPTTPVKSNDPIYAKYGGYFNLDLFNYYNPVSLEELNKSEGKKGILNFSLRGGYEIISGLNINAYYSLQKVDNMTGLYYSKKDVWGGYRNNGYASRYQDNATIRHFESTLSFTRDIATILNVSLLAGYSDEKFDNNGYQAQGYDYATDNYGINNLEGATYYNKLDHNNNSAYRSYFGHLILNINRTFFVTGSANYEGSLRSGLKAYWGFFPSVGAGVDFSRLLSPESPDRLKLRFSYGVTANQLAEIKSSYDLKPEKRGEFDTGIDFSMNKSKLTGSLDYYIRTTSDIILLITSGIPPVYMYPLNMNHSKLRSSGLELSVKYDLIDKPGFSYSIILNPTYNISNKLVSLSHFINGAEVSFNSLDLGNMGTPGQFQTPLSRLETGKPLGQLLALEFDEIDKNGYIKFSDLNKDGRIDALDRAIVGNGLPKFLIGFGNMISLKNWDLNIFFRGVFGHDLVNTYRGFYEVPNMVIQYNLPKTASDMRNSSNGVLMNSTSGSLSSKDIENASFISLDNASIGYNFPLKEGSFISKIHLYVAGNNLFYITKYKGSDPNPRYTDPESQLYNFNSSQVSGIDRMTTWSRTRSFTFGANISF